MPRARKSRKPTRKEKPSKGGRPTGFKPEYSTQAFALALLGITDEKMAGVFGVSEATLNNWKRAHPEFFESLKNGRSPADAQVASSLYKRALRGDVTACIFWLKNRGWRDKPDLVISNNLQQTTATLAIPAEVYRLAKEIAQQKFSRPSPITDAERPADDGGGAGEPMGLQPAQA